MNYLGHAFLSFNDVEVLTGNMIGDHVKGKLILEQYPEKIRKGIMIHRNIDSFTDTNAAANRAKIYFREVYGLYAGAIVDVLFDHFLANDPKHFPSEKHLLNFTENTYNQLDSQAAYFPEKFAAYFPYMRTQNWLYHYRTVQGMQRSLQGLYKRATQMPEPLAAYNLFIGHYYQIAQCYYEFMDDVISTVKIELSQP